MQQEIIANRNERKERFAAFLRLQYQRSMQMLQASNDADAEATRASIEQIKEDRQIEDLSLFLYRLDSDFEDKKRRLEKMLFQHPVRIPHHRIQHPQIGTLHPHYQSSLDELIASICITPPDLYNGPIEKQKKRIFRHFEMIMEVLNGLEWTNLHYLPLPTINSLNYFIYKYSGHILQGSHKILRILKGIQDSDDD